jgi:type IV pilus assembly protein PilC
VSPNQNKPVQVDGFRQSSSAVAAPSAQAQATPTQASSQTAAAHSATSPQAQVKKSHKPLSRFAVSRDAREFFTETLSMLLSTGVPVATSLEIISKEMTSKKVRKAVLTMRDEVDNGGTLWKAIAESGMLAASSVALIKAGEESGKLPENLKVVSDQTHRMNILNAKIRSALIYPAFLIVMLVVVGSGISLFLLPRLAQIFNGLDVKLNLLTRIMIGFGLFWSHWGLLLTGLFFVAIFLLAIGVTYLKPVRVIAEKVLFIIPGVNTLIYQSEISRLGFLMGSLLDAGLPIVEVLDSLTDSFATLRYRNIAKIIRTNVEEGKSIASTFELVKDKKALPGPIRQLIISSEKSGNLSSTLLKISDIYQEKVEISAQNLETIIEPIILIFIAIGVLFVALSVILPIYGLLGGIK